MEKELIIFGDIEIVKNYLPEDKNEALFEALIEGEIIDQDKNLWDLLKRIMK